jgi:hypothetical protein
MTYITCALHEILSEWYSPGGQHAHDMRYEWEMPIKV